MNDRFTQGCWYLTALPVDGRQTGRMGEGAGTGALQPATEAPGGLAFVCSGLLVVQRLCLLQPQLPRVRMFSER